MNQKFRSGQILKINGKSWLIAEFRLGRGRQWVYTLKHIQENEEVERVTLNEAALEQMLTHSNKMPSFGDGTDVSIHP